MRLAALVLGLILLPVLGAARPSKPYDKDGAASGLRNVTVLIVRHAEKPDVGRGLAPQGGQRAGAYASYFDPLVLDGNTLLPQRLIATSDSRGSERPRLTLEPLAAHLQLPIEQPYADKEVAQLVESLRTNNQAAVVLIAWHHGHINDLVTALGGNMQALTGNDKWPGDIYNWLIVLRFDEQGQLMTSGSQLVHEHLLPGD